MFSWMRRKKNDQERLEKLMQAFAVGNRKAIVHEAIATVGVKRTTDVTLEFYVGCAAVGVLKEIKSTTSVSYDADQQRVVDLLFLSVFSDFVSRILEADLRMSLLAAEVRIKKLEDAGEDMGLILEIHNTHTTQDSKIQKAIGSTFVRWINAPSKSNLDELVSLYEIVTKATAE